MATRIEKELERRGNKVNSVKDKIAKLTETLRQEEEKERETQNMAIVELVRNLEISYSDLKNAISVATAVVPVPAEIPKPVITETVKTNKFSDKDKENQDYEELN